MSAMGIAANAVANSILPIFRQKASLGTAKADAGTLGKTAAPLASNNAAATNGTGSGTGTTAAGGTDIGSTFLNLLVKELQNQDPTAPMDSTAMVGQMISLNQLDQLISINQAVNPTSTTLGATGRVVAASGSAGSAAALAERQALMTGLGSSGSVLDPTLSAAAASNASTLNLTNFNSMFGGK